MPIITNTNFQIAIRLRQTYLFYFNRYRTPDDLISSPQPHTMQNIKYESIITFNKLSASILG